MTATTLYRPTHRETLWALEAAFDRGDLVTVFGECTVEYDGRAASSLGLGARLLVLKPDGAALVHTDEGRTPVNWQPPGSEHRVAVRDGRLRVRSVRENPVETLDIAFRSVAQFAALPVSGGRTVEVRGSEADLRERILADPSLVESGFEPLGTERETGAGPVDVFGRDGDGAPVVVELKRRRVGPDAAGQLARYVDAVTDEFPQSEVRGILVAPSITERTQELLRERGLEFVSLAPPEGGSDGDAARPERPIDSFDGSEAADDERRDDGGDGSDGDDGGDGSESGNRDDGREVEGDGDVRDGRG